MNIVYFNPNEDDWSCADKSSEELARTLLHSDVHTSNESVLDYVRVLIAEDVLDCNNIEIRFIKGPMDVEKIYFNEYGRLNDWPIDFMQGSNAAFRLVEAQEHKRKRKKRELLAEMNKNGPLMDYVTLQYHKGPERKIETVKGVRTRMPELDLVEAKAYVDNVWNNLHSNKNPCGEI